MIISLSDNEQNINAALNSLDIIQRLNSVTSQIQKETALTQQMNVLAENYRKLIKDEISTLLDISQYLKDNGDLKKSYLN